MKAIIGPMRLPFVILSISCVLLGVATAIYNGARFNIVYFILTLVGALAAHISVNAFNEYEDFNNGLDFKTKRTPFSGGSGALPLNPSKSQYALYTAILCFALTCCIGLYFLLLYGWGLLPLGLLGIVIILTYSKYLIKSPFLCLIAPGLGFGPVMVIGSSYVMAGHYSMTAFWASLVPFFLVNNLLLLNQFPDIDADVSVGRKNVLINLGKRLGAYIFSLFFVLTFIFISAYILVGIMPWMSAFALLFMALLSLPLFQGLFSYVNNRLKIENLLPSMGINVILNLTIPALLAIAMLIPL